MSGQQWEDALRRALRDLEEMYEAQAIAEREPEKS